MGKGLTEIVMILDMSGSMVSLTADTIGSFNSLIRKQRMMQGECLVSTVLFNATQTVIHDRVPLVAVSELTENEYITCGSTALLDAVGTAIHHIAIIHKYARKEDVPENTIFIITTDGMENASRMYTSKDVRSMIERQKTKYGWEFIFLGANIDAVSTADDLGIEKDNAVDYIPDKKGTQECYSAAEAAIGSIRMTGKVHKKWKGKVEEDYNSRK
ncbi:MAG: hypothetical protein ACI4NM_12550 [Bullifex sp.]